ncbi:hypothetical protein Hanom_Chr07g00681481 [Helianthus anomalus]
MCDATCYSDKVVTLVTAEDTTKNTTYANKHPLSTDLLPARIKVAFGL